MPVTELLLYCMTLEFHDSPNLNADSILKHAEDLNYTLHHSLPCGITTVYV
jgi:hypothetical protein